MDYNGPFTPHVLVRPEGMELDRKALVRTAVQN